jgi:hypothetical protein
MTHLMQSPAYYPAPMAVYEGMGEELVRPTPSPSSHAAGGGSGLQLRKPPVGRGAKQNNGKPGN